MCADNSPLEIVVGRRIYPRSMRASVISTPGGPAALRWEDVPGPTLGDGELLVDVVAAGVNRADILQREGHYPAPPDAPPWPGLEVSGRVTAVAPGVEGWREGDEVCALLPGGGYAEQVAVPAGLALPVPAGVSLEDAAALPEAAATAWSNLVDAGRLRTGESALVHGGSGGVGSFAVQLAAALGARVLATARDEPRCERVRSLGADVAVPYADDDVATVVLESTGGSGVDVALDVLGAGGLDSNLRSLATGGRLVIIGLQRGARGEIDLGRVLARRLTIVGTTLRSRPLAERVAIIAALREHVWPLIEAGRISPVVHATVPMDRAGEAHELLDSGEVFGKLLLVPPGR